MSKSASPNENKHPSDESPFTAFVRLDGKSSVPSEFRSPDAFTVIRLRSPAGLSDRITKLSAVPALLVSVSLEPLPRSSYQLWTEDRLIPTSAVGRFRSNVIDFASGPRCWAERVIDVIRTAAKAIQESTAGKAVQAAGR